MSILVYHCDDNSCVTRCYHAAEFTAWDSDANHIGDFCNLHLTRGINGNLAAGERVQIELFTPSAEQ